MKLWMVHWQDDKDFNFRMFWRESDAREYIMTHKIHKFDTHKVFPIKIIGEPTFWMVYVKGQDTFPHYICMTKEEAEKLLENRGMDKYEVVPVNPGTFF